MTQSLAGCTVQRARELVGSWLVIDRQRWQIWETEAYCGADDPASHAYRGRTPRNDAMFGRPGTVYVYLCYGVHHCVNLVTESEGVPGAILLRAVRPEQGLKIIDGPGLLCRALGITREYNGRHLSDLGWRLLPPDPPLHVEPLPRIGIRQATDRLWRFRARP